uniref:Transmembrane protein 41B n=1 Tax=Panagrellus redivivus TaxID=6233 RepID=A0A7E4USF5_PANRE
MPLISKRVLVVGSVILLYGAVLYSIYTNFPELDADEKQHFKYPRNLDDAKALGKVLSKYKDQHFYTVLVGVAAIYIVLQSFAIPGSIFLTILSGYLFPFPVALGLVCTCSALGAAVCYCLSYLVGRTLVTTYFPERVAQWQTEIQKHRENLFNYIIVLRITPVLPNWFINIASPVIDVSLTPFFWGTLVGVAPPSMLFIQAGTTLQEMVNANVMWSWTSIITIIVSAIVSLLPVVYRKYANKAKSE